MPLTKEGKARIEARAKRNARKAGLYDTREFLTQVAAVIREHGWTPVSHKKKNPTAIATVDRVLANFDWPAPTAEDAETADAAIAWARKLKGGKHTYNGRYVRPIAQPNTSIEAKQCRVAAYLVQSYLEHERKEARKTKRKTVSLMDPTPLKIHPVEEGPQTIRGRIMKIRELSGKTGPWVNMAVKDAKGRWYWIAAPKPLADRFYTDEDLVDTQITIEGVVRCGRIPGHGMVNRPILVQEEG